MENWARAGLPCVWGDGRRAITRLQLLVPLELGWQRASRRGARRSIWDLRTSAVGCRLYAVDRGPLAAPLVAMCIYLVE
jgi:hypothetical protein